MHGHTLCDASWRRFSSAALTHGLCLSLLLLQSLSRDPVALLGLQLLCAVAPTLLEVSLPLAHSCVDLSAPSVQALG